MAKTLTAGVFSSFKVNEKSAHPAYRQLYQELRASILSGRLPSGARLPATRVLADDLGVSRNTILSAFTLLIDEGYVVSKVGAGSFVAHQIPEDNQIPRRGHASDAASGEAAWPLADHELSQRGRALARMSFSSGPSNPAAFTPDVPAYDAFPLDLWGKIISKAWRNISSDVLGYVDPAGYWPLRVAIARHVRAGRMVDCKPEQVIVTSGSQQSFDLLARLLLDPGDAVWIEEPGYLGSRAAMLAAGARVVPVPVDAEGLNVAEGIRIESSPRMVVVSPSRQYPLGMTLSPDRREQLLELSKSTRAWIIEDDYDSEYRYSGQPLPAIQSMDKQGRVIYLGTFSKSLLPAFRLGYLIVPKFLLQGVSTAKAIMDRHPPILEQIALQEFMEKGYFASHIRRMRHLYAERKNTLVTTLRSLLPPEVPVIDAASGMHIVVMLPNGADDMLLSRLLSDNGVIARPLSPYYLTEEVKSGLLLGFAAVPPAGLVAASKRFANIVTEYLSSENLIEPAELTEVATQ
jgi:GntR family transcriptional regulator / MocR family aminotransferase